MGRRLGYSTISYVSDMERGLFVPAEDELERIALALELRIEVIKEVVLGSKIEGLGITEPAFVSLFKEFSSLSRQDKREIIRAYYKVRSSRKQSDGESYPGG